MWNELILDIIEVVKGTHSLILNLSLADGFNLRITGVYGPNSSSKRRWFWPEMYDLSNLCEPNWIMGGDFNISRWSWEKSNQKPPTKGMKNFNKFIESVELLDIPMQNGKYTWSSSRAKTLIDRFLITDSCIQKFGNPIVNRLPSITSDHFPIKLTLGKERWGPTSFKFSKFWLSHKSFEHMLQNWWSNHPLEGWPGHGFMKKLKDFKYYQGVEYQHFWQKGFY